VVIELTEVGFVIDFVIIFYIFEAEWLLPKAKTGNVFTDLCSDIFRFLSLTMKFNLPVSSYTFFPIKHMDINNL